MRLHHICTDCPRDELFANREALHQHKFAKHWCPTCHRLMSEADHASHTHAEDVLGAHASIEDCPVLDTQDQPETDGRPLPRSQTRTPSFSPPYMRPSIRQLCSNDLENDKRRQRGSPESDGDKALSERSVSEAPSPAPQTGTTGPTPQFASPGANFTASDASQSLAESHTRPVSLSGKPAERQPPAKERKRRRDSPQAAPVHCCNICGKPFNRRTLRDNHLRTHTNDRPFPCSHDGCPQTFKQKNEQTRHEQTKHQEKKFVCGGSLESGKSWGCGKSFARSDGLLEHQTKTQRGRECTRQRDEG